MSTLVTRIFGNSSVEFWGGEKSESYSVILKNSKKMLPPNWKGETDFKIILRMCWRPSCHSSTFSEGACYTFGRGVSSCDPSTFSEGACYTFGRGVSSCYTLYFQWRNMLHLWKRGVILWYPLLTVKEHVTPLEEGCPLVTLLLSVKEQPRNKCRHISQCRLFYISRVQWIWIIYLKNFLCFSTKSVTLSDLDDWWWFWREELMIRFITDIILIYCLLVC